MTGPTTPGGPTDPRPDSGASDSSRASLPAASGPSGGAGPIDTSSEVRETLTSKAPSPRARGGRIYPTAGGIWGAIALPVISILLALVVGAVLILLAELIVSGRPFDPLLPIKAYASLFQGAFGSFDAIVETLVFTTPLVLAGLAVGLGFKGGLFNIGAQGQFLMGVLFSVWIGVALSGQPGIIAAPAALVAGMIGGAIWGFIPGFLKAFSGAHEVVTTIMLNYIAIGVLAAMVSGALKAPGALNPITGDVGNAALPILVGRDGHLGIVIAGIAVVLVAFLLYRTTRGFEIRTAGANPDAARYAGMRPSRLVVFTMSLSGLLAGLAGTVQVLGISHIVTGSYGTTVGFDSIAVALLGRSNPIGIVFAALLFGSLRAGAGLMQINAGIPPELVDVLQATILLFLVANPVLRRLFKLGRTGAAVDETQTITRSYGGQAVAR
jgi:simple sugar transport system permease protein